MDTSIVLLQCRTCLGEFDESKMVPLFEEDGTEISADANATAEELHISKKLLEFCCGIKVRQSPHMPSKICHRCTEFVRMWFGFRQMCLNSQVYLESSCLDGEKPEELVDASDSVYLEYLYEALQSTSPVPGEHTTFKLADKDEDELEESHASIEVVDHEDYIGEEDSAPVDGQDEFEEIPRKLSSDSSEMLIAVLGPYDQANEVVVPSYPDDNLPIESSDAMAFKVEEGEEEVSLDASYVIADEDQDGLESSTPSPYPIAMAVGKRKPGRPRKPDHLLTTKRRVFKTLGQTLKTKSEGEESEAKFICAFCGNVYQNKKAFTAHTSVHSEYKPHQCEICSKSFRQMGELRAHIRRHTGERPFKCLYCDRHFYDRSEKVRHERVHTNTRPYACKECGKTFTHMAILKNHSLIHSGQKDYNCTICSKSFALLHQLKAHLQTLTHRSKQEQAEALASHSDNYVMEESA